MHIIAYGTCKVNETCTIKSEQNLNFLYFVSSPDLGNYSISRSDAGHPLGKYIRRVIAVEFFAIPRFSENTDHAAPKLPSQAHSAEEHITVRIQKGRRVGLWQQ